MKLEDQVCEFRKLRGGGYAAIHKWLVKHYGKADQCENESCDRRFQRFHWAKKKGVDYEHKRESFWRLCTGCHRRYDHTSQWAYSIGRANRGKLHSESHKQAISIGCKGIHPGNKHSAKRIAQMDINGLLVREWDCLNDAAKALGISPSGITMCARGQLKKSGGFKWIYLSK